MDKKKILIVNNNMHIGGVQRALVNLLKCIHDRYDVTLALFFPEGELAGEIPEDVKVLPVHSAYRFLGMTKYDVQGRPLLKLMRSFFAAVCRLLGRDAAISLMALGQKKVSGYDVAISYLHDAGDKMFYGGCNDFVLRHTDAPRKCAFLHCDFLNCGADTAKSRERYAKFQCIAACSDGCRNAFLKALPNLSRQTTVVCNCQDYEFIRQSAEQEPVQLPANRLNVLTVARLGREKGVPRAIEAFSRLEGMETLYHYYIVGDGAERSEVEALIQKYGLEKQVSLLGEMTNPFGYMKDADFLLMPSVNEAAPMVIGEAACLDTPILTTKTTSALDMVEKTGFGWVCENSTEGLCEALRALLHDSNLIAERTNFLAQSDFDNALAVAQFDQLIGEDILC